MYLILIKKQTSARVLFSGLLPEHETKVLLLAHVTAAQVKIRAFPQVAFHFQMNLN